MSELANDKAGTALLSFYDKDGLEELGAGLIEHNWQIVSSGGTANELSDKGIPVTRVEEITGYPSILGGRVKTLHPLIHGAILSDPIDKEHIADIDKYSLPYFDLVGVDMYPLEPEIADPNSTYKSIIEKIDVGGPTMLNGAAKSGRLVLSAAHQRPEFLERLREGRLDDEEYRQLLAARAFYETSRYYLPIMTYLGSTSFTGFVAKLHTPTKYGENAPQIPSGLYADNRVNPNPLGLDQDVHVQGMERSTINMLDMNRSRKTLIHLTAAYEQNFGTGKFMAVGAKHNNACGVGVAATLEEAVRKMIDGDNRAIHGGVVTVNGEINEEIAKLFVEYNLPEGNKKRMLDGVVGSSVTAEAMEILNREKLRLVINPALAELHSSSLTQERQKIQVMGGMLEQPNDTFVFDLKADYAEIFGDLTNQEKEDLLIAHSVARHSNSNTIIIVKDGMMIGPGVGQQDRVGASQLALTRTTTELPTFEDRGDFLAMITMLEKAKIKGAKAASDSFFGFADAAELLASAGVDGIITTWKTQKHKDILATLHNAGVKIVMAPDEIARGFSDHS